MKLLKVTIPKIILLVVLCTFTIGLAGGFGALLGGVGLYLFQNRKTNTKEETAEPPK